jgi:AmiR/NasT family two-component response regulator
VKAFVESDAARLMTKPLVLLCKRDRERVRSIAFILEAAGFDVLPESDPRAAWDSAQTSPPDFALLDTSPPHREDMALARQLSDARVPFVILSAHGDGELVGRAIKSGAMGCFFKPLDVSIIVPSIRAWIARATELVNLRQERQSLLEALRHHRSTGAAVGVIMERHGLTLDGAFEALRRRARNERQSVAKLGSAVVAGTVELQLPKPGS